MGLSARLTAAMVALVVITASAVGLVTYHNIDSEILPDALFAGTVVAACAVGLAILTARSMTRPLVELTRAVEAFARGDAPEITTPPVEAIGEIGVLARAISRMAAVAGEKAEAARHSAELLDISLASMADGVLVLDPTGQVLFANPACKAMFGAQPEVGSPEWLRIYRRFNPDGVTPFPAANSPISRAVRGENFDNVEIIVRRAGETGSIHIVASGRVLRDERGRFEGAVIVYRDVTELTEKTAEIRRNAEIFGSIMSSMVDAVLLVDENVNVVFANHAAHDLMRHHAMSGIQDWSRAYRVFAADGVTPLVVADWPFVRAVRGEHIDNFEIAIRADDDDRLTHLVFSGRPIRGELNAPRGAVIVLRDITELKETERLLRQSQKMDAIGQLTGGVAHDFNNILTVITGTIEILADGVADRPSLAAIAKLIDEAATRGSALTQQLLAFARRQPLQPRRIDINVMVLETARLLRPTLGEQIEIEAMLGRRRLSAIIDPSQLSTALLNLAVNARDAMPDGGKLTLETSNVIIDEAYARGNPEVQPGAYVMIAVSDTGTGIPRGDPRKGVRAVLHHQGRRQGHRPRPEHGLRLRQAVQRAYQDLQRGRPRHDDQALSAAQRRTARLGCRAHHWLR